MVMTLVWTIFWVFKASVPGSRLEYVSFFIYYSRNTLWGRHFKALSRDTGVEI